MSEKLTDPDKAAHEIVGRWGDGEPLLNDGRKLKSANTNPWYVLATIYGEYKNTRSNLSMISPLHRDHKLHVKNRRAWNGWFCQSLTGEEISVLVKEFSLGEADVARLTSDELHEIKSKFVKRMGSGSKLPVRQDVLIDEAEPDIGHTWEAETFNKVLFKKPVYFDGFLFDGSVNFGNSVFQDEVSFSKALFFGGASFWNTHFSHSANFFKCKFVKDPHLKSEEAFALFPHASFSGEVDFGHAEFEGEAAFRFATFSQKATFTSAEFRDYAAFRSSTFLDHAIFRKAQFGGFTNFASADFKSTTRFNDARFQNCVPEFYGASLFENVRFSYPPNYTKNWPQLSDQKSALIAQQKLGQQSLKGQKRAYNRLRLFMNESLQVDEEQFFHRMEMRCKRGIEDWRYRWIYTLFEGVSDYGNSALRPVMWLIVVWLSGAIAKLKAIDATSGNYIPDIWSAGSAAAWSFANLFPLFGFRGLYLEDQSCLHYLLQITGGVQTVAGFVLLFFLGLGLRNRFRLR